MCGICGIANIDQNECDPSVLGDMIQSLRHRGPDALGSYRDSSVQLGHTRLSIIDLAGGRQPMRSADGSVVITFNGEIFNYRELRAELVNKGYQFRTQSDTEVVLNLYREKGEDCVKHLNGQWAFAIWDTAEKKLFLSRDRLGVRPLFYTQSAGKFVFASEIKALLTHPEVRTALDVRALDEIFTFWVALPPRTAFKDVWQLPPGHSLTFRNGELCIWKYWQLEFSPEDDDTENRQKQLTEELLSLLFDATRLRLRADVPVGAYLSGGLDSTLITALTSKIAGERLRTFSVAFDDVEFDESAYQREASDYLGTQHSEVQCSRRDIANVFPEVIWHSEQPLLRTAPAPLYLLAKLVRESGFKVVLTGEGSDEFMGGYDIYKEAKIRRFWARDPDSLWRPRLLKRLYPYMAGVQRQPLPYLRNFFSVDNNTVESELFSHLPRWELTAKLKMFFTEDVRAEASRNSAMSELDRSLPEDFASWHPFNKAEFLEANYFLPGYILSTQGDRMAMAHGVEGRYPFLDHRVVEFAAKLPPRLKMKVLDEKYLLKQAADGLVPESIRLRHKQPYRAPDGRCFQGLTSTYLQDMLSPARLQGQGIFNPEMVLGLLKKFGDGRATSTKDDMALVGVLSTQVLVEKFLKPSSTTRRPGASGHVVPRSAQYELDTAST